MVFSSAEAPELADTSHYAIFEGRKRSALQLIMVSNNLEIVYRAGYIYLMETDEEFDYWYNNPPPVSEEGSKNCPPRFRN